MQETKETQIRRIKIGRDTDKDRKRHRSEGR